MANPGLANVAWNVEFPGGDPLKNSTYFFGGNCFFLEENIRNLPFLKITKVNLGTCCFNILSNGRVQVPSS